MSTSPAISNNNSKRGERRGRRRETLNHYVVLVFFGQDNWGKLINMSESGLAFEFSEPPSLRERVNFTLQVMGCMPMPHDASVLGESFEAAGEIVWAREFESVAGLQFVDLAERNRRQIQQWLSFERSTNPFFSAQEAQPEVPPVLPEPFAPLTPAPEAFIPVPVDVQEPLRDSDTPKSGAEPKEEFESSLPKQMPEIPAPEIPAFAGQGETVEWQPKSRPRPHPSVARLTFLVVSGFLAAFAVTAGVRMVMVMTGAANRADVVERAPGHATGASSAEGAPPFRLEVLDAGGKRWMLWFDHNGSKNGNDRMASKVTGSPTFTSATESAKSKEIIPLEAPQARTFALVAPGAGRPASNGSATNNLSTEAPAIQTELPEAPRDPIVGTPAGPTAPAPEATRVGGMVQQARLIQSMPPAYPALARANRVSGDVLLDALIDASGKVTDVKVISGPVLLQQAAIETVRHWKYEPARLDEQAVAMHLTVTVKFHLN